MRKDNPAVYECKRAKNTIHLWVLQFTGKEGTPGVPAYLDPRLEGAICENCKQVLNEIDTRDMLYEHKDECWT